MAFESRIENQNTLREASNYALSLRALRRFEEAKALMRKVTPVARRVLGQYSDVTFMMRTNYALALFADDAATLGDLREAVTTLEEIGTDGARRVFGGAHPIVSVIERAGKQGAPSVPARAVGILKPGSFKKLRFNPSARRASTAPRIPGPPPRGRPARSARPCAAARPSRAPSSARGRRRPRQKSPPSGPRPARPIRGRRTGPRPRLEPRPGQREAHRLI